MRPAPKGSSENTMIHRTKMTIKQLLAVAEALNLELWIDLQPTACHQGRKATQLFGADGGIHFGTPEQASMKAGKGLIYPVHLKLSRMRRVKDEGSFARRDLQRIHGEGYDAVVYLNRYEGISRKSLLTALEKGWTGEKLDELSDEEFKAIFPEAQDSYIIFDPDQAKSVFELDDNGQDDCSWPIAP